MSENNLPATRATSIAEVIERVVRDPTIEIARFEAIIALQERIEAREAKRQFAEAMARLQAEMPQVTRDAVNPFARSRYATYEAIDREIRPYYTKHGFSTSFRTKATNGRMKVTCVVRHVGGHEEAEHEFESGPDQSGSKGQSSKTEVQGFGSVITYGKKYTLCAAFGIALQDDETDDDGVRPPLPFRSSGRVAYPPQPQHTQPKPNGGDVWMKETIKLVSEPTEIDDKAHALRERLVPWSDNVEALERFSDNLLWKAYVAEQFPPDSEILTEVVVDLIQQARGTAA